MKNNKIILSFALIFGIITLMSFYSFPQNKEYRYTKAHRVLADSLRKSAEPYNLIIAENYQDLDLTVRMEIDTLWAYYAGDFIFNNPLVTIGQGFTSCASCHNRAKAGFAGIRFGYGKGATGVGEWRQKFTELVDSQKVATPTHVNSIYSKNGVLWDGSLNCESPLFLEKHSDIAGLCNKGYNGIELQAAKGSKVHNLDFERCKKEPILKQYFKLAFGDTLVNKDRIVQAIVVKEQIDRTPFTPFNQFLMGKNTLNMSELRGLRVFLGKCISCHNSPALGNNHYSEKIAKSDFKADKIKAPTLINLPFDGFYMHNSSEKTIKNAIRAHQLGLTKKELTDINNFIRNALVDATVVESAYR